MPSEVTPKKRCAMKIKFATRRVSELKTLTVVPQRFASLTVCVCGCDNIPENCNSKLFKYYTNLDTVYIN